MPCGSITARFDKPAVNKNSVIKKILAQLASEVEQFRKAADAARAEATHEQSRADNKYDTRGLEASYLARGQSMQAAEVELAIEQFSQLSSRAFGATDPIDLGALVELEGRTEKALYFVGPRAGGTEVVHDKREILVITSQSPLGKQLVGKKQGDKLQIEIGGRRDSYKVLSVA